MSSIEWEYSTTNGIHDTFEVELEVFGKVFEVLLDVGVRWEVMMFPFDHCVDCGHKVWGLESYWKVFEVILFWTIRKDSL